MLAPNCFDDLAQLARTLNEFEHHYNHVAEPFDWRFTRADLAALLDRLASREPRSRSPPELRQALQMNDPLRRLPPERTLRWASEAVGAGSRIASLRRLTMGGWHTNHALTVIDGCGGAHRLVLRRWARPEWRLEDPDFTAEREASVLELLSEASIPTPRLIAADHQGVVCDVPTLLLSRLPGRPPGLPADMDAFLVQLAETLVAIHAFDGWPASESPTTATTTTRAPLPHRRGQGAQGSGNGRSISPPPNLPRDGAA